MNRRLPNWASQASPQRPRWIWPSDLGYVAKAWRWGRRRSVPASAPEDPPHSTKRRRSQHRPASSLWLLRRRLMIDLSGLDAVCGVDSPVVVAANHTSALDLPVLRAALPRAWRCVSRDLEAALAAGRSVIVFPEGEASSDGRLRPFSSTAAELARNHNVPLVPVAIKGTFQLKALLSLRSLKQRPKVGVRIGRPIAPRLASISETTILLERTITDLLTEDQLTWWDIQRRGRQSPAPESQDMAPWRRLWNQTEPQTGSRPQPATRIWPDPKPARRRISR